MTHARLVSSGSNSTSLFPLPPGEGGAQGCCIETGVAHTRHGVQASCQGRICMCQQSVPSPQEVWGRGGCRRLPTQSTLASSIPAGLEPVQCWVCLRPKNVNGLAFSTLAYESEQGKGARRQSVGTGTKIATLKQVRTCFSPSTPPLSPLCPRRPLTGDLPHNLQ
jgi:hypothetical protein